jgi:hypothetical protein
MKFTAITLSLLLWIAALGVLLFASVEGRRLRAVHSQIETLQAERSSLEARLAGRARMNHRRVPSRSLTAGATHPAPVSAPDFAAAPPLAWIRTAHLRDAGNATPKAAFESVLWAANQADVDALTEMIHLREGDRALVDSFLAKLPESSRSGYGTPEHLLALFMAENPPVAVQLYSIEPALSANRSAATGSVNVIALTQDSSGQSGYLSYTFQPTDDGWKMATPNLPGGGIRAYLAKIAVPAAARN